jgi:hypothetical protein
MVVAYLEINGEAVPTPKRGVSHVVSTIVNSGRNVNGIVVGQRLGVDQFKLDNLEWPWLSAAEWSRILKLLNTNYAGTNNNYTNMAVDVSFYDPVTNAKRTLKMYPGDRSAEPYWIDANGHPTYYRNCKVNLIDTGWRS